jgi:hypothetical protein
MTNRTRAMLIAALHYGIGVAIALTMLGSVIVWEVTCEQASWAKSLSICEFWVKQKFKKRHRFRTAPQQKAPLTGGAKVVARRFVERHYTQPYPIRAPEMGCDGSRRPFRFTVRDSLSRRCG